MTDALGSWDMLPLQLVISCSWEAAAPTVTGRPGQRLLGTALCVCPTTFNSRSIAECRASSEATVPHIKWS